MECMPCNVHALHQYDNQDLLTPSEDTLRPMGKDSDARHSDNFNCGRHSTPMSALNQAIHQAATQAATAFCLSSLKEQ